MKTNVTQGRTSPGRLEYASQMQRAVEAEDRLPGWDTGVDLGIRTGAEQVPVEVAFHGPDSSRRQDTLPCSVPQTLGPQRLDQVGSGRVR